jgi:hypothetical protein
MVSSQRSTKPRRRYLVDVAPAMVLIGIGGGLGFPSLMGLAMSGATPSDSGLASGLVNTSVQVGGAIGLAVLATLATERPERLLANGETAAVALNSGFHLAYLIGAGLVGVAVVLAVTVLRPHRAPAAARRVRPSAGNGVRLRVRARRPSRGGPGISSSWPAARDL